MFSEMDTSLVTRYIQYLDCKFNFIYILYLFNMTDSFAFFLQQKENKMTLQNVSIVLSPTMQISHRVLNVLFLHTKQIFKDVVIKR